MIDIKVQNGLPEVEPSEIAKHLKDVKIIDVRRPEEYNGEGHIPGAELATLGPDFMKYVGTAPKDQLTIFVCKVGGRSAHATVMAQDMGFTAVANLKGGMDLWNQLKLPVVK